MKVTLIDNGFYKISRESAYAITGKRMLPQHGRELLCPAPEGFETTSGFVWLARTIANGKEVWSIRDSKGWKMNNGRAELSS
jgi:hypothetical protein